MNIGFLNNQIDNRGTGNAIFDYANYAEQTGIVDKSYMITMTTHSADFAMADKIRKRFGTYYTIWDVVTGALKIDYLYHIKYGNDDTLTLDNIPYGVHAVFDGSRPHGDRYATISEWMGKRYNIPHVPHIVSLEQPTHDLRAELHIPDGARVFGRHGGYDTFDIPWAWEAINDAMARDESIYCLFLNTKRPDTTLLFEERFRFIDATSDRTFLSSYIYACDAMVHARSRGETFGIAVGEFAIAGKPVITYGSSGELAHLDQLGGLAYIYYDQESLTDMLLTLNHPSYSFRSKYLDYNPLYVMNKFRQVFLNGFDQT